MEILETLNFGLSIIIGLLILVILVVVHELGHAIVARRNGVVVEEFGIGFPPRAWKKKLRNGVLLTLNWLPLGGFVKLQGEHDSAVKKGDYGAASFWVKTKILLAGVAINWLVAAVLLTGLALVGIPKIIPDQFSLPADTRLVREPITITAVVDDSPAEDAGLLVGDQIVRFNDQRLESPKELNRLTAKNQGQPVDIRYNRDGVETTTTARLNEQNGDNQGYLGVGAAQRQLIRATWSAPIVGFGTALQLTWFTLQSLGDLLVNFSTALFQKLQFFDQAAQRAAGDKLAAVNQNVAGPIGILGVIFPAARQAGLDTLIFLTALISLTLAVINTLPIPALDGGRWFTMTVFRLARKPLTRHIEERINATGFLILMGLVVLVTVADIGKLAG